MIMDMQIGLFCGVFSIIASLIVYAILSFYSIKEDSFDEAKANRRKFIKEYFHQSRSNCDKTKQKKSKKASKKAKDKKLEQITEEIEAKKENKAQECAKEIIVPVKEASSIKKSETVTKVNTKGKLQNMEKENTPLPVFTPVSTNEVAVKKVPEKKAKNKVLDKQAEVEIMPVIVQISKESEKKLKSETKAEKKKTDNALATSVVRKQVGGQEKQVINVKFILSLIQKAELSRSEIQLLIDTLLNSEDETSEWLKVKKLDSGRQDSSVKLKKQLSELEVSLKSEKQITMSLQNKLKELRIDMASDKTSLTSLKETISRMQQEKDDLLGEKSELSSKFKTISEEKQEMLDQLNKEKTKAQHQQKLDDDRHHDAILSLQEEIKGTTSQLELLQIEKSSLLSSISILEEKLQSHKTCQDNAAGMERTLHSLSTKINERDSEVSHARKQIDTLSSFVENYKKENEDLRNERENLAGQLATSFKELEDLKEENKSLLINLDADNKKENINVANGLDSMHDPLKCQLLLEEKDNLLTQLSLDLDSSSKNLNELKNKLSEADKEINQYKGSLDQANADIFLLKGKVNKLSKRNDEYEEVISQLRNNVNEKSDELTLLKEEVEKYKQRNNELRNKNWKVIEALSTAEKTLQTKLKLEEMHNGGGNYKSVEELKNNVNTFVRRLFPDITIQEYKGHFNEWLRSVEETVVSNNLNYCSEDLQTQNSQLQSLVSHYKTIISDTEDMLNKLQNHIEVEESKWKEHLNSLQKEIDSLRALHKNNTS